MGNDVIALHLYPLKFAAAFGKSPHSQWDMIACQLKYGCQPCNTLKSLFLVSKVQYKVLKF